MKKILVTGGCGFIGSNFIKYMLDRYTTYKILNLDLLTYCGNTKNLEDIEENDKYTFIKGDISDRKFIFDLFEKEKFDIVINFAAESHVDKSIVNPSIFIKTNIVGTQVLLEASLKYKVSRYHQVSTDEVYGDLPIDRPDLLFTEETPLNPSSPYSSSKASGDLLVNAYHRTYDMNTSISRCSNNYGPYQFPEKLIPKMIYKALDNNKLPVYGDGQNIRDWIHVYDHCTAIDYIVHNGAPGGVYNVGSYNEKTNLEIVSIVLSELNKDIKLIDYIEDRPGHDLRYAIDSSKIKNELNWVASYDFKTGIKETIDWYINNKDWILK